MIKLFVLALLTASLLSSVATINVPALAGEDKHGNDDNNGNNIKAKNDDGQQSIGINDCQNIQQDFENSNDNAQDLNCEILINNLQDVRDTTNTVGNELPDDGENGGVPTTDCEDCFAALDAEIQGLVLSALRATSLSELCEMLDAGEVNLAALEQALEVRLPDFQADAIVECVADALGIMV